MDVSNESNSSLVSGTGDHAVRSATKPGPVQPGIYILFIVELFILASAFWSFVVLRATYPEAVITHSSNVWFLIAVAAAVWGTFYSVLARGAFIRWERANAGKYLAIALASGIVLVGVVAVTIARVNAHDATLVDLSSYYQPTQIGRDTVAAPAQEGDPASGKTLFATTCASCHGPTGDGVANNAPSLRSSEFLKSADEPAVATLIRNGRAATDPANKTGKVMPARGGNPFLDDAKINDLAAFLLNLESQIDTDDGDGSIPTVQLNRWIIPEPPHVSAMNTTSNSQRVVDYATRTTQSAQRQYQSSFSGVFVTVSSVMAFHFLWVIGLASAVVLSREFNISGGKQIRLIRQSFLFWSIGVASLLFWFLLFAMFG